MSDELEPLRKATKGLLYPSDTDAPIEVVSGVTPPANAEVVTLDAFFDELADTDDAARFAKLRVAVDATLSDAKVYRVGSAKGIAIFVLGTTAGGATGGIKTTSIET